MAYLRIDPEAGGQNPADTSTVQNHPLGARIRCYDPTYGEAEFVYVKGVASAAVGLFATYNAYDGTTALTAARSKGLVGVFVSTLDAATKYGWLCVRGCVMGQVAASVVKGATVYVTATAGKVDDAVVAGDIVYGANFATADGTPAANQAVMCLAYPYVGDTDNA